MTHPPLVVSVLMALCAVALVHSLLFLAFRSPVYFYVAIVSALSVGLIYLGGLVWWLDS